MKSIVIQYFSVNYIVKCIKKKEKYHNINCWIYYFNKIVKVYIDMNAKAW